ncbi:unnamed protein product [Ectocarpus sp. 8 AP-2014]
MSLVLRYRLNDEDAYMGKDSSDSGLDITNLNVTLSTDPTHGSVGYFDGTASLTLPQADVPTCMTDDNSRTMSYWKKMDTGSLGKWIHSILNFRLLVRLDGQHRYYLTASSARSNNRYAEDTWYHIVLVYDKVTGTLTTYSDGQVDLSTSVAIQSGGSDFMVGDNVMDTSGNNFKGVMTDLRVYDYDLDSTEISALFAEGPNPPSAGISNPPTTSLGATMYTHVADIAWASVDGASTYRLTQKENSGPEVEVQGSTTDTSVTVGNLTPGASYEFSLYTDLDDAVPAESLTSSTPEADAATTQELLSRFGNNLGTLGAVSPDALGNVSVFFDDVASTGDVFVTDRRNVTYVKNNESVQVESGAKNLLTPFSSSAGSGQTVTINSSVIGYDESTNKIVANGTNYSVGDAFVLGGYKVTVKDEDII